MAGRIEEVSNEYKSAIQDLTFNSKPLINALTMLAEDNKESGAIIIQVICDRIKEVNIYNIFHLNVLSVPASSTQCPQTKTGSFYELFLYLFPLTSVKNLCKVYGNRLNTEYRMTEKKYNRTRMNETEWKRRNATELKIQNVVE